MKSLSPPPVAGSKPGLSVNGERREVSVDPSTPLLWVLREELKMTGTKYGCGIGACGACTVHLGGVATRSCLIPVELIADRPIVTIEAIVKGRRSGGRPGARGGRGRGRRGGGAGRVLPERADHERGRAPHREPCAHRHQHRAVHGCESLSVWNL